MLSFYISSHTHYSIQYGAFVTDFIYHYYVNGESCKVKRLNLNSILTSSLSPFRLSTVCHPPLSPIVGTTQRQVAWRAIMFHILAVYEKVRRYSDTWKHRRRMNNVLTHTIELTAGEPGWPVQCVCVCRYAHAMCASLGESVYACVYMHTAALFLNVCVHAHMYSHVTMTVSYITLVKEIGIESACECQC